MALYNMNTSQLAQSLKDNGVPDDVYNLLIENNIDGTILFELLEDQTEFMSVFPKSSQRLVLKRVVKKCGELRQDDQEMPLDLVGLEIPVRDLASYVDLDSSTPCTSAIDIFSCPLTSTPSRNGYPLTSTPSRNEAHSQQSPEPVQGSTEPVQESPVHGGPVTVQESPEPGQGPVHQMQANNACKEPLESKVKSNEDMGEIHVSSKIFSSNLPVFPDKFSIRVETAIQNGSVHKVRRQLIADIGAFYYGINVHPLQGDYKQMAKLTCEKFPQLKDSSHSKYWITVQKQLSQYFRNLRRYSKATPKPSSAIPTAKRATASKEKGTSNSDDGVAQKRNFELLKEFKDGAVSGKTFTKLVDETFQERRKYITTVAQSSSEILHMCPYLEKSENLRNEMQRIAPSFSPGKGLTVIKGCVRKLLDLPKESPVSNKEVVNAVGVIERRLNGKKSVSILKFKDPSTRPDALFKDKMIEFRLVVLGKPDDVQQAFVSGESRAFCETKADIAEACIDLICAYYVFDVSYPECMQGMLFFLQDFVLELTDDVYRGTKYNTFIAELKN